ARRNGRSTGWRARASASSSANARHHGISDVRFQISDCRFPELRTAICNPKSDIGNRRSSKDGGHLAAIAMKDLLEAGVHFGHQTKRWNPKMKEFIFGERNGIYIIDLGKTVKLFREAEEFVTRLASEGRTILFVGTKRQAQDVIAEEAQRCGMFYVNERWLGGLLTNFATIQRSLGRLRDLETMATDGRYDTLSKKEIARNEKERRKLQKNLEGIRGMSRLPDAVFVVDTKKEKIAVDEARKLKIPVIGIVDTNCDPDEVDLVIPGNDDAL